MGRKRIISFLVKVGQVFLILVVLSLLFVAYGSIDNRWYRLIVMQGGSMFPTLRVGDAILITRPPEVLEPGMIVVFQVRGRVVTHRITEIAEGGCIRTKGDANENEDGWMDEGGQETQIRGVVGICRARFPYLGYILNFPRTVFAGARLGDAETSSGNLVQAGTWDNPHPPTETPEPTEIPQPTETPKPTETVEPSPEPTETAEPTQEPTGTVEPTPTETPTDTPIPTEEPTDTPIPTEMPIETPTVEPSATVSTN